MKPEPKWLKIACVLAYFVSLPMVIVPLCLGPFLWKFENMNEVARWMLGLLVSGAALGYAPFILIFILRKGWREEPEHLLRTSSQSGGAVPQKYRG